VEKLVERQKLTGGIRLGKLNENAVH